MTDEELNQYIALNAKANRMKNIYKKSLAIQLIINSIEKMLMSYAAQAPARKNRVEGKRSGPPREMLG